MRKLFLLPLGITVFIVFILAAGAEAGPLDSPNASKALVCSACHGWGGNSPGDTGADPRRYGTQLLQKSDQ